MGEVGMGRETHRGLSAETLKWVAMAAMVIDHAAFLVSSEYYGPAAGLLHFVGRITAPIVFFFIAEGYRHTRNANRYTLRLAIFAVISYLPYVLYFNNGLPASPDGWLKCSVISTLLLGLLAVRARREVKNPVVAIGLIGLCLVFSVWGDWGFMGVISILLFDLLRGNLRQQRVAFCLLALVNTVMPLVVSLMNAEVEYQGIYLAALAVNLGILVPMALLGFYNGQRGKGSKWAFYIFYPAHLLVLFLLAKALGIAVV